MVCVGECVCCLGMVIRGVCLYMVCWYGVLREGEVMVLLYVKMVVGC